MIQTILLQSPCFWSYLHAEAGIANLNFVTVYGIGKIAYARCHVSQALLIVDVPNSGRYQLPGFVQFFAGTLVEDGFDMVFRMTLPESVFP